METMPKGRSGGEPRAAFAACRVSTPTGTLTVGTRAPATIPSQDGRSPFESPGGSGPFLPRQPGRSGAPGAVAGAGWCMGTTSALPARCGYRSDDSRWRKGQVPECRFRKLSGHPDQSIPDATARRETPETGCCGRFVPAFGKIDTQASCVGMPSTRTRNHKQASQVGILFVTGK